MYSPFTDSETNQKFYSKKRQVVYFTHLYFNFLLQFNQGKHMTLVVCIPRDDVDTARKFQDVNTAYQKRQHRPQLLGNNKCHASKVVLKLCQALLA